MGKTYTISEELLKEFILSTLSNIGEFSSSIQDNMIEFLTTKIKPISEELYEKYMLEYDLFDLEPRCSRSETLING